MATTPPKRPRLQLEDLLLRHGAISEEQLAAARQDQAQLGGDVGRILVDRGFISEELLLRALAHQMEIPLVDPEAIEIRTELLQALPVQVCERYGVIAVDGDPGAKLLRVATPDPGNREHLREVERHLGMRLQPAAATSASIERAIRRHYYGEGRKKPVARMAIQKASAAVARRPAPAGRGPGHAATLASLPDTAAAVLRPPTLLSPAQVMAGIQGTADLEGEPLEGAPLEGEPFEVTPVAGALDEQALPEASLEPELEGGAAEALASLEGRLVRLEALVTQPQFAAALARVERLEQIAAQLAQAVRVIGGVLVDHDLVSLADYRKRTGQK